MIAAPNPDLELVLQRHGYMGIRLLPSGEYAAIMRFAFTFGLTTGLDRYGYRIRYCYEHLPDAAAALLAWDGGGDPGGPWIKAKGRGLDGSHRDDLGPGARGERN